jgi:hypothetical protein
MAMTNQTALPARESPEAILSLLRKQALYFAQLKSLADQQRLLVAQEDVAALLALLAKRGELSEQLTDLDQRLRPIRRDWKSHRAALSADQGSEADRLLSESSERLKCVMEGDARDARILCGRKHTVATALDATHRVGEAISAYRAPVMDAAVSHRMDEGV